MGVQSTIAEADQPRIYVACLAAYNSGRLHGAWIDATKGDWAIWDGIRDMLAASPIAGAEEYAIHDYEGFGGVRVSESEGVAKVAQLAAFVIEHGELGAAVLEYLGSDLDEARAAMADQYLGCYGSLANYVQEMTWGSVVIPEALQYYIDWEAMARDAEMSGDLFAIETGFETVHVFAAR